MISKQIIITKIMEDTPYNATGIVDGSTEGVAVYIYMASEDI